MLTKISTGDHCTAHQMCSYTSMIPFFFFFFLKWVHHVSVKLRLIKNDYLEMHAWMLHFQQRTKDGLGRIHAQFQIAHLTWENKVNSQKNLGAMRMGVRLYRWFNLPRQFWMVFNVNAKLEIFFSNNAVSSFEFVCYNTIPEKWNILCQYRCGSSVVKILSYYGDMAKRVAYFYIFKKWRLSGLIYSYTRVCVTEMKE